LKRDSGIKLLKAIFECAKTSGVYDKMCLGFGSALGAVRPSLDTTIRPPKYRRGIIPWDKDSDLCFLGLKPEEKELYFSECKKAGLFKWGPPHTPQERISRKPDGEILWFSLVEPKQRARCCQWFCFEHQGWMWHTKGKRWLGKFNKDRYNFDDKHQAILKGTPAKYYEDFTEIDFEGFRAPIPTKAGSLLDEWYGGWGVPKKGGASRKKVVCIVKDWDKPKTWRIT